MTRTYFSCPSSCMTIIVRIVFPAPTSIRKQITDCLLSLLQESEEDTPQIANPSCYKTSKGDRPCKECQPCYKISEGDRPCTKCQPRYTTSEGDRSQIVNPSCYRHLKETDHAKNAKHAHTSEGDRPCTECQPCYTYLKETGHA